MLFILVKGEVRSGGCFRLFYKKTIIFTQFLCVLRNYVVVVTTEKTTFVLEE
jgi:hypothetical protein